MIQDIDRIDAERELFVLSDSNFFGHRHAEIECRWASYCRLVERCGAGRSGRWILKHDVAG